MFKMDDLPRRPSLLLKVLAIAARWSLWLLLGAWLVMLAAWAALHLFIVPRIGELRPQLETRASQSLGVTVRIESIEARPDGLVPAFELRQVRLIDPAGREALRLPRVLVALSPRSLWRYGFEQLYIEQPQLDIQRTADGRILVAGLDLSKNQGADSPALDWLFSQTEFVIRGGTLHWRDEQRDVPPLTLQQVDLVLRNTVRSHALRIDATPPAEWGRRLTLMAHFREPLLSTHAGQWRTWEGQVYARSDQLDLAQLRRHARLGLDVAQGSGALRAWVDISQGQVTGATADVALSHVEATLTPRLGVLSLPRLTGRLGGRLLQGGFEFSTQDLQFDMENGQRWPGGNVRVVHVAAEGRVPARGELQADRLDLAALAHIADRLPVDERLHAALSTYAPKGLVERIQASWQGSLEAPGRFEAKGRVSGLEIAAGSVSPAAGAGGLGSPGVRGASVDFDLNQAGGRAALALQDGRLEWPGLFEVSALDFAQLNTDVQWQIDGGHIHMQLPNLRFSNADVQGEAQLKWQTADAAATRGQGRLPGVLDLQGSLSRADVARVHRYLPLAVERDVRDYLRDALVQGQVSGVRFRVKGDLNQFPFANPKQGEFRITASVRDATYAYVPRSIQPANALPWPALTQVSGDFVFDRIGLQLKDVSARLAGAPGVRLNHAEAQIPNLLQGATVQVSTEVKGPLGELLGTMVNGSPLGELTGHALRQASAGGSADLQLKLKLPLMELHKSTVQGKVTLAGNDLQLAPDLPRLSRVRGAVHFSENGFAVSGGQARALGGDLRAEGGTIPVPGTRTGGPAVLRVQGNVTAEGLRQARELGVVPRLAQKASGSTNYTLVLGFRRGVPELLLTSSLQGLALNLPAPLNKGAETALPLRIETVLTREAQQGGSAPLQDQLTVEFGRLASAVYVRDVAGAEARVLRGALGVGLAPGESVPLPADGVAAHISMQSVDVDAWGAIVSPPVSTPGAAGPSGLSLVSGYLPTSLAIRARELTATGRKLNQVVVGGSREGQTWRANLDAQELSGYLEYRQPVGNNPGRVYARLARLSLAASSAKDVETLLDEQPVSIPALDVVVDDMELRGKRLGRVEIEAVNRGAGVPARDGGSREWRLNRFNILMPEAVFTATGNWALLSESASARPSAGRTQPERRRTVMNFRFDIADAGELLARFGMKDVVRRGKGRLEGQIAWAGSPLALDYPTLGGAFSVNVENGQFLKADPGIAKLLGVLSLQSLPRRLTLDFRDVFSEGFAFDFVRGDIRIDQGIASTNNLQMKGVNAAVLMDGRADIARETQDIKVVVVPEINAGTASLIAGWINPAVGLGSFLAQLVLRRPLIDSATEEFQITGSWSDPKITRTDAPVGKADGKTEGAR
jgi:uncharacterized protein (TIGR02099 family)